MTSVVELQIPFAHRSTRPPIAAPPRPLRIIAAGHVEVKSSCSAASLASSTSTHVGDALDGDGMYYYWYVLAPSDTNNVAFHTVELVDLPHRCNGELASTFTFQRLFVSSRRRAGKGNEWTRSRGPIVNLHRPRHGMSRHSPGHMPDTQ